MPIGTAAHLRHLERNIVERRSISLERKLDGIVIHSISLKDKVGNLQKSTLGARRRLQSARHCT
eukprot:3150452-Amphidinium_carterae.1